MKRRVLIVYSRDMKINDAGASRTTILLANYIAAKGDMECYTFFSIIEGANENVLQIPRVGDFASQLRTVVSDNCVDIVLVPEGVLLGAIVSNALEGLNCKIVSAHHNVPGWELRRLWFGYCENYIFAESLGLKLKAILSKLMYPIMYSRIRIICRNKYAMAYNSSDKFILLSDKYNDDFIRLCGLKDNGNKLVAIENGLSFDNYATDEDVKKKEKQILVVSRFDERSKRLYLILKIWSKLHKHYDDWKLVIAGDGRWGNYYKTYVSDNDLKNVEFVGMVHPMEYYRESKIFLMTSAYEGWPMTIMESQQMGCVPVVLNTFKSITDIIDDGLNGYITESIAQSIERVETLINDSDLCDRMAKETIISSKRFESSKIYEKYYNLFKEL